MQKVLCSGSMSLVEICLAWELGSVVSPLRHSIAWLTGVFFPSAGFDHWIFHFDGQLQHFSGFTPGGVLHDIGGSNRVQSLLGTFGRASRYFYFALTLFVALFALFFMQCTLVWPHVWSLPAAVLLFFYTQSGGLSGPFVLLFLGCAPGVSATCTTCFDSIPGCAGSTACPLLTGVAGNAAGLVAATATVLSVAKLLPSRILRAFTRPQLEAISAIARRPVGNAPYDFEGKSAFDIQSAVASGLVSSDEASTQLHRLMNDLPDSASALAIQRIQTAIESLRPGSMPKSVIPPAGEDQGALLFVLAKVTATSRLSTKNFATCLPVEPERVESTSSGVAGRVLVLTRPKTLVQTVAALNQWVMVLHATGLVNVLVLTPFLDEVFFEPLRNGEVSDHRVAFEMLVLYLQMIVNSEGEWTLANVYVKSGGLDVVRKRAEAAVLDIFRADGGIPEKKAPKVDGAITAFTASGGFCLAYNLGNPHKPSALLADGSTCRFNHRCDLFVKDKGANGRCEGSHPRHLCDYPTAQRGKP